MTLRGTPVSTIQALLDKFADTGSPGPRNAAIRDLIETLYAPSTPVQRLRNLLTNGIPIVPRNISTCHVASAVSAATGSVTITVDSTASLPQSGQFPVQIDQETFWVTSITSTTLVCSVRGGITTTPGNGTVAAAHSVGAPVLCGPMSIDFSSGSTPQCGDYNANRIIIPGDVSNTDGSTYKSSGGWSTSGKATTQGNQLCFHPQIWTPQSSKFFAGQVTPSGVVNTSAGTTADLAVFASGQNSVGLKPVAQVHAYFDGQYLEIFGSFFSTSYYSVLADYGDGLGLQLQHYGALGYWGTQTSNIWLRLNFQTARPKKIVVYGWAPNGGTSYISGLAYASTATLLAWDRSRDLSVGIQTDSFGDGTAQTINSVCGFNPDVWWGLGASVIDQIALGGTSICNNGGTSGHDFFSRDADFLTWQPDVYFCPGSVNDGVANTWNSVITTAQQATIKAYYADLRAKYPNSILVGSAPWCPVQTNLDATNRSYLAIGQAHLDGLRAVAGPWMFFNPQGNYNGNGIGPLPDWTNSSEVSGSLGGQPWQTGTGYLNLSNGSPVPGTPPYGNGPIYDNDQTHPTRAGAEYIKRLMIETIRQAAQTL